MSRGLFLDRDGVIVENRSDYIRSWSDVEFLPGALDALAALAAFAYKIVVVTNQSAVGRGIVTLAEATAINDKMLTTIRQAGGRIDGLYMCPHAPAELCRCRKPLPGLLLDAASDLGIRLHDSIMVGDALTDVQAGQLAGITQNYLVLTGRGWVQSKLPEASDLKPFRIIATLAELPTILKGV